MNMINDLLWVLQAYQVFFAGLLGFVGVLLTMKYNSKIQREKVEREIKHQANSLRTALKSELLINKESYEKRAEDLDVTTNQDALIRKDIINNVYLKSLDKIGLLTEGEVGAILKAYLLLGEVPYRLQILVGTDNVIGIDKDIIRLRGNHVNTAAKMHAVFLKSINHAISSIDKNYEK